MDKTCATCQYFRQKKWEALTNAPEPPWCSNSKSPFFWKSVKATDGCKEHVTKKAEENTASLSRKVKKMFGGKG